MRKKILFVALLSLMSVKSFAIQNYSRGNFLIGLGIGAGSASILPVGSAQLTLNPSVEIILGAWNSKRKGIALGFTVDSSINFFGSTTGSIAPMLTLHTTLLPRFDWYVSLGMGLQLLEASGTKGGYNINVGFGTGFNVVITPAVIWYVGMALHADQFFGSTGIKIRFSDKIKIKS